MCSRRGNCQTWDLLYIPLNRRIAFNDNIWPAFSYILVFLFKKRTNFALERVEPVEQHCIQYLLSNLHLLIGKYLLNSFVFPEWKNNISYILRAGRGSRNELNSLVEEGPGSRGSRSGQSSLGNPQSDVIGVLII